MLAFSSRENDVMPSELAPMRQPTCHLDLHDCFISQLLISETYIRGLWNKEELISLFLLPLQLQRLPCRHFFSGNGRRRWDGVSERLTNEGSPDLDARAGLTGMTDVSWQMCFLPIFMMDGQQEAF